MRKDLYIIGNGFDKHHNIPCGYQDYREWLIKGKNWELLETIDELFGYTDSDWWKCFEENLASAETLRIATEATFQHYPDFGSDDFRDRDWYEAELSVERKMNNAYKSIKESFVDWVNQLPEGNADKCIQMQIENSVFLSFNYTQTLENLYSIPQEKILHIHGRVDSKEELVFGHGLSCEELEETMGQRVDEGDYVYQKAKDAAVYAVSKIRKPVDQLIKKNNKWFLDLNEVTHVHIYGHSFSKVDLPYYREIFRIVDVVNAQIEVSAKTDEDHDNIINFMQSEKIPFSDNQIVKLVDFQMVNETNYQE